MNVRTNQKKRKAVFIDRDGVINNTLIINGRPHPPKCWQETMILPGVQQAVDLMHSAGWILIVITNQPDVARGKTTRVEVEKINSFIKSELPPLIIRTCFHDESDNCMCRKPKPGAIITAALDYDIDLSASYMVGDRWSDIEAGNQCGCKTVYIDYEYSEVKPLNFSHKVGSLLEAAKTILKNDSGYDEN